MIHNTVQCKKINNTSSDLSYLGGSSVPYCDLVTWSQQVHHHALAHNPKSKEANSERCRDDRFTWHLNRTRQVWRHNTWMSKYGSCWYTCKLVINFMHPDFFAYTTTKITENTTHKSSQKNILWHFLAGNLSNEKKNKKLTQQKNVIFYNCLEFYTRNLF